jgi:hypothetical protein
MSAIVVEVEVGDVIVSLGDSTIFGREVVEVLDDTLIAP